MWEILWRWTIGDLGVEGEYQYQPIHIYTVVAVLAVCLLAALIGCNRNVRMAKKQQLLKGQL